MNIHWHEEIDSTSAEAQRLLRSNHQAPFAVSAGLQTAGRGQQGKAWESPRGNLYLSLVMPVHESGLVGLLPLYTATVLSDYLFEHHQISLTLKWPNDLLLDGAKLGGILCECSVQGGSIGPAVIGIGLNTVTAPQADHRTAALHQSFTVADFVHYWETRWDGLADTKHWLEAYQSRMIQPGHKLGHVSLGAATIGGISMDGALSIRRLGKEEALHSASAGWRWVLQDRETLLVADIGNTAVKLAEVKLREDGGFEINRISTTSVDIADGADMFAGCSAYDEAYVMSVNPAATIWFEQQCLKAGITAVNLEKRRVRCAGRYPLAEIGIDRLAACESFVRRWRNKSGLVVSCGTACTIDALDAQGRHLGGWILPGRQTALNSLQTSTAKLPKLVADHPARGLEFGLSTAASMQAGTSASLIGAIELARALLPPDHLVILTGGEAAHITRQISGAMQIDELLLEGCAVLALAGA